MILATRDNGTRDGELLVVDRTRTRAVRAEPIAATMQRALDDWKSVEPRLGALASALEAGGAPGAFALDRATLAAPLPRAYSWIDSSVYLNHMELARKLRGAAMPEGYQDEPRFYDGVSHRFLASGAPLPRLPGDVGLDIEGEVAAVLDDLPQGSDRNAARAGIRLFGLVNDTSLRTILADSMARGYTNFHAKPPCSMAPFVVTPDELGTAWDGDRLHLRLEIRVNDRRIGNLDTGADMAFDFPDIVSWATRTRPIGAGTILAAGTVSNRNQAAGSACLAEVRMHEKLAHGAPRTPYLEPGDTVRIEAFDAQGISVFGAIEHRVVPAG